MAAEPHPEASEQAEDPGLRSTCGPAPSLTPQTQALRRHYAERVRRERQVINLIAIIGSIVVLSFAVIEVLTVREFFIVYVQLVVAAVCAAVPFLHRFGKLVAPLTLTFTAYVALSFVTWHIGSDAGLYLYFLVGAMVIVMVLGLDHIVLACTLVAIGTALMITLELVAPEETGEQPMWALNTSFVLTAIATAVMVVAAVVYALREVERAEDAMEVEYERSESLITNMLPTQVVARLKSPSTTTIADKFDDASVLFADIADYTERASQTSPVDLVEFLNRLYTEIDRLVGLHGLEKVKTTGDCYMVVSGLPQPRPDHLEALARLALNLLDAVAGMTDNTGRAVPLRIGLAVGPVVAGVVGSRRYFYDVWGDAVNVASRMESTGVPGRIQVSPEVYERLKDDFEFDERGDVVVKGKGVMRTWFLVGQRTSSGGQLPVDLAPHANANEYEPHND